MNILILKAFLIYLFLRDTFLEMELQKIFFLFSFLSGLKQQTLMISHYSCWEGVRAQLSWVLWPGVSLQASVKLSASRVLICRLDWVGNLLLSSLLRLWLGGEHAVSCGQ